jgi:hypothetical protein
MVCGNIWGTDVPLGQRQPYWEMIKSSNKLYGGNLWQCIFTYKVFTCMISIVNHIVNCPWNYACSILKYPIFSIGIIAEATLINFVKLMTFSIIKVYKIRIVTKAHHIKSFVIIYLLNHRVTQLLFHIWKNSVFCTLTG